MKVFIVFLSLIMVFCCLCVQSTDMAYYKQLNVCLKNLAEEAACGAGLMTGESECYSDDGIIESDAQRYVDFLISAQKAKPPLSNGTLSAELEISGPAVSVTVFFVPDKKIFHLFGDPPIPLSQNSVYEWILSK